MPTSRAHNTARQVRLFAIGAASLVSTITMSSLRAQAATKAPASQASVSTDAESAYERAAKKYSTFNTIDALFEQRIHNPLLNNSITSHGRFLQQRPNKVSINFTDPIGDRIVVDGTSLWMYLPSSVPGQVLKLPANSEGAMLTNLFGQLLDAPRKSFAISGGETATINGRASRKVLLVPHADASVPFQRATLWIDDAESRPLQLQLIDAQGVDRTITIRTWTANGTLPADAFRFTPPAGVKVVKDLPGVTR